MSLKFRSILRVAIVLIVGASVFISFRDAPVIADELSDLNQQIQQKQKEKEETLKKISAIDSNIKSIASAQGSLYSKLSNYESQKKNLDTQIKNLETQITDQEKVLKEYFDKLVTKEDDIKEMTNYLYKLSFTQPDSITNDRKKISDFVMESVQTNATIEIFKKDIKDYKNKIKEIEELKVNIQKEKELAAAAKSNVEEQIKLVKVDIQKYEKDLAAARRTKSDLVTVSQNLDSQLKFMSSKQKALLDAEQAKMRAAAQAAKKEVLLGQFYFSGTGRDLVEGHGLGMSQWGAFGMANQGWTYDQILKFYYTGVTIGDYKEPQKMILTDLNLAKRVIGEGTISVTVGSNIVTGQGTAFLKDIAPNSKISFTVNGADTEFNVTSVDSDTQITLATSVNSTENITNALYKRNSVSFDDYMAGIGEVPNNWPPEAVKAQVVAARTYAMGTCKGASVCNICTTAACQVYVGGTGKKDVALATKGKVILYGGEPIVAYYSASHRGHSSRISDVWGGADKPYIQPVIDDQYAFKDYKYANPYNPSQMVTPYNFKWSTNGYTMDDFTTILSKNAQTDVGKVSKIRIEKENSPIDFSRRRVARVVITGDKGEKKVTGWDFRAIYNANTPFNDYIYSTEFDFLQK